MARKLHIQYPGAIYHVMNRADLAVGLEALMKHISGQYTLKGEERIEVLGKNSKQNIVFSPDNLKEQKLKD